MKRLGIMLLFLISSFQLAGCIGQNSTESEQTASIPSEERVVEANGNVRFSYLVQLPTAKKEAFEDFKVDRNLQHINDFTPEDMVIVYLHSLSIGDPDLLYAITYNGGMSGYVP